MKTADRHFAAWTTAQLQTRLAKLRDWPNPDWQGARNCAAQCQEILDELATRTARRYKISDRFTGHTLTAEDFADRAEAEARAAELDAANQRAAGRPTARRYVVLPVTIPAE